jgi:hypothetical protein
MLTTRPPKPLLFVLVSPMQKHYETPYHKYISFAARQEVNYHISQPIRHVIFYVRNFGKKKNNDECILIYWMKRGLLHTKISNHNIIYSS